MRKAQKQEILEALKSLAQAHEEIKEELHRSSQGSVYDMQRTLNMLSECQEFAISLGEVIEKFEGENHTTAQNIGGYCDIVYEAYMEINKADGKINEIKIYKMLKKQLLMIESSAKNDIAVKKEVVFLPYKASMWDSMESVWMAARDDENCDAYVIAIPY